MPSAMSGHRTMRAATRIAGGTAPCPPDRRPLQPRQGAISRSVWTSPTAGALGRGLRADVPRFSSSSCSAARPGRAGDRAAHLHLLSVAVGGGDGPFSRRPACSPAQRSAGDQPDAGLREHGRSPDAFLSVLHAGLHPRGLRRAALVRGGAPALRRPLARGLRRAPPAGDRGTCALVHADGLLGGKVAAHRQPGGRRLGTGDRRGRAAAAAGAGARVPRIPRAHAVRRAAVGGRAVQPGGSGALARRAPDRHGTPAPATCASFSIWPTIWGWRGSDPGRGCGSATAPIRSPTAPARSAVASGVPARRPPPRWTCRASPRM